MRLESINQPFDPSSRNMSSQLSTPNPAADLSLQEMLQIMDVARTFRNERISVEQQLSIGETRAAIREKLLASARVTGSDVNEAEVDAAIDLYFHNLHTYHDPPWGPSLMFAQLYVRRWTVGVLLVFAGLIALVAFLKSR